MSEKDNGGQAFKPGDQVRLKIEALSGYTSEFQRKVAGRIGVINSIERNGWKYHNKPFVVFPAVGRKKEYRPGQISSRDLELVTDK